MHENRMNDWRFLRSRYFQRPLLFHPFGLNFGPNRHQRHQTQREVTDRGHRRDREQSLW